MSDKEENKLLSQKTGAEMFAVSISSFIGTAVGGPFGAVAGGLLGVILTKICTDLTNRNLSSKEEERITKTLIFANQKTEEHIQKNHIARKDDFYKEDATKRSNAIEIIEGILLKSKDEYQENKLEFFGYFLANISFYENISIEDANHMLNIVSRLTYRQMCILSLIGTKNEFQNIKFKKGMYRDMPNPAIETIIVFQEIYDIINGLGLVNNGDAAILGWYDIMPNELIFSEIGQLYFDIMELHRIPKKHRLNLIKHLT